MPPSIKIVVVEDDLNVAAVLEARLRSFGYDVCGIARSGPAAVRMAQEHRPDLMLMDILLEGRMNGIEAAELIHDRIDVPIVFLTCLNDQRMFERALKTHAYGYILKPYGNAELKFTLQTALIKHQSAKEKEKLIQSLEQALAARKRAEEALLESNEALERKVTERTRMAEARSKQLQALAVQLIEVEERERRQFAALLHDDLQQILAAARMQLQLCEHLASDPVLEKVGQLLEESISKSRSLSHELSPAVLHHSGLIAALEWLARRLSEQFGLEVRLEVDAAQQVEGAHLKVFLFRAVQELLFNTVKHAGVSGARVALSADDGGIKVVVCDQGRGFRPEDLDCATAGAGIGLLSIQERAQYIGGSLLMESAPGRGSRFTLKVPFSLKAPNDS